MPKSACLDEKMPGLTENIGIPTSTLSYGWVLYIILQAQFPLMIIMFFGQKLFVGWIF